MSAPGYTTVIGLEVHVQVATATKLFCGCAYAFGAEPNSRVCPVCLGLPGALPVLNERALELGIRAGVACGCTIAAVTRFDRKNYFYPDLPKGYQISQFDKPYAEGGAVPLPGGRTVALERIHLEEDAGKNTHAGAAGSLVDLNRCSVPLLEVVSRPDIRSPEEAWEYLTSLKGMLRWIGVSECDMEKGSLRCDANVSLMPAGTDTFGTKVEIKNLNSFRMVQRALAFEQERQAALLDRGEPVLQETRLWDEQAGETRSMRSKEEAHDYRYFPEPDLPPQRIPTEWVERIRAGLPELPMARRERFVAAMGLSDYDAMVLTAERELADFFEAVAGRCGDPKAAANWVQGELLRLLKERGAELAELRITPAALAGLIDLVKEGKVTGQAAKKMFDRLALEGGEPEALLASMGLAKIDDREELAAIVAGVLAENPGPVAQYLGGKETVIQALMGGVMRGTRGRANPQVTMALLKEQLEGLRE